jgi:hypothetical protein
VQVLDEHQDGGPGVFGAGADVVEFPADPEGELAGRVGPVGADAVVGVGGAVAGLGFRAGGVGGGGRGPVRQGAVRAAGVVDDGERVEQGLQISQGGGLDGLGAEPVLHGLLESLHLALGLGVVRFPVLLDDPQAAQLGLQSVAAAPAAREPGSEDQTVIGQSRGRGAVGGGRGAERGQDGRAGDPDVGGERESIAGVVIEPVRDLGVRPVRERVVGEVGLPALVGLLGGEANAGDFGRLAASGVTRPWRAMVRLTVAAETPIRW